MYAQEIAMNVMWSQREYDAMSYAILDGSCTDEGINICTPAILHARHNPDPFSKFAFLSGKYRQASIDLHPSFTTRCKLHNLHLLLLTELR